MFLADSFGFCTKTIMSSVNKDNFIPSFLISVTFISFSCLITLARTSNTVLKSSGEKGHPCLDLSGEVLSFSLVSMTL